MYDPKIPGTKYGRSPSHRPLLWMPPNIESDAPSPSRSVGRPTSPISVIERNVVAPVLLLARSIITLALKVWLAKSSTMRR